MSEGFLFNLFLNVGSMRIGGSTPP
jgi:hypothetical protein